MRPRNLSPVKRRRAWKAAEAAGFDMSVVAANLQKSPWERIRQHSRALAAAQVLRQAMKERHGRS